MNKQIKNIYFILVCVFIYFSNSPIFAQFELEEKKIIPQIGLWFGPVTPIPGTQLSTVYKTSLGGGLFFRINFPNDTWRIEAGSSFSYYTSLQTPRLLTVPNYLAISFFIPIEFPLKFQLKVGGGATYFQNRPQYHSNTHGTFYSGFEIYFPAGKYVNVGLRIDYYLAIEEYIKNAKVPLYNAHLLNIGLSLSFNIVKSN